MGVRNILGFLAMWGVIVGIMTVAGPLMPFFDTYSVILVVGVSFFGALEHSP